MTVVGTWYIKTMMNRLTGIEQDSTTPRKNTEAKIFECCRDFSPPILLRHCQLHGFIDGIVSQCNRFAFSSTGDAKQAYQQSGLGRGSDEAADGEQSQIVQECGAVGEGAHVVEAGG